MAKMYQGQPALEYWEATQKVLQGDTPIVRRPRLTEALLKKPPFRFLHDIITEVCRQTEFAGGLFSPEEQTSSNMKGHMERSLIRAIRTEYDRHLSVRAYFLKRLLRRSILPCKVEINYEDKESKVAYLWKIINCAGITLNAHVPARPLKIVSGMEPEPTNIFLQMLAAATTVDSPVRQRAVSRVLLGEKMPSPEQGTMDWAHRYFLLTGCVLPSMKEGGPASTHRNAEETIAASLLGIASQHSATSNDSLDLKTGREEMDRKNPSKHHQVGNPTFIASSQQPSTIVSRGTVTPGASRRAEEKLVEEGSVEPLIKITTGDEAWPPLVQPLSDANLRNCGTPHQQKLDMPPSTARTETLPSAARPMTVGGDGRANYNVWAARLDTLGGFPSFAARPQSARKGPPKIHNGVVAAAKALPKNFAAAQPDMHSSSLMGGGGKDISSRRRPGISLDRELEAEDEPDSPPVFIPAEQNLSSETVVASVESRKVTQSIPGSSEDGERAVERAGDDLVEEQDILLGPIEATNEDAQTREEVQNLRVLVQALCQATNPLGKAMDYLQEDEEAMNKEHHFWIKERDVYRIRLGEEKRITDEMLQAETVRILELEEEFQQYQQKITSAKAQILRNDDTIMNLLRMVTTRQLK